MILVLPEVWWLPLSKVRVSRDVSMRFEDDKIEDFGVKPSRAREEMCSLVNSVSMQWWHSLQCRLSL